MPRSHRPEPGRTCLGPEESGGKADPLPEQEPTSRANKDGWTEFSKRLVPKTGQMTSSLELTHWNCVQYWTSSL